MSVVINQSLDINIEVSREKRNSSADTSEE